MAWRASAWALLYALRSAFSWLLARARALSALSTSGLAGWA